MIRKFRKAIKRKFRWLKGRNWYMRSLLLSSRYKRVANTFLSRKQESAVFILGTGRSGTQLVSDLIGVTELARVFHEPDFYEDVSLMHKHRENQQLTKKYWNKFRKYQIYERWSKTQASSIYCEVNGTLRYQIPGILQEFPDAKLFLLVRDGRGFVRSLMGWTQFYSKNSKGAYALSPFINDPYYGEWDHMTRFEKICWMWQENNEFLMGQISEENWLRIEDITSDFDYFTKCLSNKINLQISQNDWQKIVGRKSRNSSIKYDFPSWHNWEQEQKHTFKRICGQTMLRLGYDSN